MALPILTALLFMNIALGVVTRAAPQLNIFAVGFPVTIMSGLLIMLIVMPIYIDLLTELLDLTLAESLKLFMLGGLDMAEEQSAQERSEEPTAKRLDESRKKRSGGAFTGIEYIFCGSWRLDVYFASRRGAG